MHRLLRELDRIDLGTTSRRRATTELGRRVTAVALGVLVVAVVGLAFAHKQFGVRVTSSGVVRSLPLGTPPAVMETGGTFRFLRTQAGRPGVPVAYDPCRTVRYEVNVDLAPPGGDRIIRSAVQSISAATGLVFEHVGPTHRLPSRRVMSSRRLPVLVAWTTPDTVPELAGRVAGLGGSTAVLDDYADELEYVTGTVSLDAPQLQTVLAQPGGSSHVRAIVMHELGHLVGLDHVSDSNELMHQDNVGQLDLGPGDREALAALGSGRCFH